MKERIRELAREAGFYANPDVEKFEKFAELIVKECVEFAYKEADHLEDEFERGRADDLRRWANVMKQHFGVEE
jgi:hypothetical protein